MKKLKGDLIKLGIDNYFDIIIAKGIKLNFPQAFEIDKRTVKGDKSKLGTITFVTVEVENKHPLTIVNAYTQFNYRGNGRKADYEAIRNAFREVKNNFSGKRIGYPAIGAGLAGGDWKIISEIIEQELDGEDHTFVEYQR
jgi:O-acetyl-ADP-ribose deacetylase (regulator of RNase III)